MSLLHSQNIFIMTELKGKDYSLCYRLIFLTLLCRLDPIFRFSHHIKFTLIKNSSCNKKGKKRNDITLHCAVWNLFFWLPFGLVWPLYHTSVCQLMTSGTISIKKRLSSASAGQQQHSVSHRWPQNDRQTHFPSLSIFVTHTRTHTCTKTRTQIT